MNTTCDLCGENDWVIYLYRGLEICPVCYYELKTKDDEILGGDEDEQS